jgi:hypothetical protein
MDACLGTFHKTYDANRITTAFPWTGLVGTDRMVDNSHPRNWRAASQALCVPHPSSLAVTERSGDRIPVGEMYSATVQTGPGAHPASCTEGTGGKSAGDSVNHSPTSSAEVKERVELYIHSPVGVHGRLRCEHHHAVAADRRFMVHMSVTQWRSVRQLACQQHRKPEEHRTVPTACTTQYRCVLQWAVQGELCNWLGSLVEQM